MKRTRIKHIELDGQIGTDPSFALATPTGHSRAEVKHSDPQPGIMQFTQEEWDIYDGKRGDVLQKAVKTMVAYRELFGTVEITG